MSSSGNRYSVLGEGSNSKEKETQMPTTGTPDQEMKDAPQNASQANPSGESSMSMKDLQESLPPSKEEARKRDVAKFLELEREFYEEEARKKRSRHNTSSQEVVRQIPSAAPPPEDAVPVEEEFNPRNIVNPERRPRCAFKYEDEGTDSGITVGDPWNLPTKGFVANLDVDGGRYGAASVSLVFRINKGDKAAPLSQKIGEYYECSVTWRAGISIDGQKVIEWLRCSQVMQLADNGTPPYDQSIVDSCPQHRQKQIEQLMAIEFECSSAQTSSVREEWFNGLSDQVKNALNELFFGFGTHKMTIWFVGWPTADVAYDHWAKPLEEAVNSEFPAFWQYLQANGTPNFTIQFTKPIKTFQQGMYAKYRPQRHANGSMKTHADGRAIEDVSEVRGYHTFDRKLFWEVDYEFGVYNIIPVIRDVQFAKGQVAHLATQTQLVYLHRMPSMKIKDKKGEWVPTVLSNAFRGFVRITTQGGPPPPQTKIRLEWDNAVPAIGKPHQRATDFKDIWWGHVMKGMEGPCRDTGTDFCVWFTKPSQGKVPRSYKAADAKLADEQLVRAHIEAKIDTMSSQREIDGMVKLAEPTNDVKLAVPRMALMSEPSRLEHTVTDLTAKNPEVWAKIESDAKVKYKDNPEQLNVLTSLKAIVNGMVACVGPPGTGKTHVLADLVKANVLLGHATLVCAVSNNAVDKAANSCWENFDPEEQQKYKFLRYETASAELQAILMRSDFENPTDEDESSRPKYKSAPAIEDEDAFQRVMAEAAHLHTENNNELKALFQQKKDYSTAMKQKWEIDSRKQSNVAAAITLPNREFRLTCKDRDDAAKDLRAELSAYRAAKQDDATIEDYRQQGPEVYRTEAALQALAQDALSEDEIQARVASGAIPPVEKRDRSFEYRKMLLEYRSVDGRMSRQDKKRLARLRAQVVIRVFQETHVVFVSCNNSGSELVSLGFSPASIIIDESGQLTLAGLANVLTSFEGWLALFLFGDPNQLLPFLLSGKYNEFVWNALLSVLAMLQDKGYPMLRLQQQFRMAPAIVQWVAKFFYKSLLRNHPSVLRDNRYRQVAREVSNKVYGIRGAQGKGSEYWMIDVANGISQVQHNGTSLQNHANADAISHLVDEVLSRGVQPSEISVLTYYTGQLNLVIHKIEERTQASGRQWQYGVGQVSSVDSFQGEENNFVFIDVVVAHKRGEQKGVKDDGNESEDDDGSEGFKQAGKVTGHVKSPNRLCCALTRGKDCVVVFCQLVALLGTAKSKQQREKAAISAMALDFMDRNLVHHDYDSLDTSPISEETRATWDAAKLAEEKRRNKNEDFSFLSTYQKTARNARITEQTEDNTPKVYRTKSRRTTRPNMAGPAADEAERHDVLVTKAGAVPLTTGGRSQHEAKGQKKAKGRAKAASRAAAEVKDAKGKGHVRPMPVKEKEEQGKGKGKEEKGEGGTEDKGKGKGEEEKGERGTEGKEKETSAMDTT